MSELIAQPGELRFTVTIKRKATGKIETFEMVGHADPEQLKQILEEEQDNGHNPQHGSA